MLLFGLGSGKVDKEEDEAFDVDLIYPISRKTGIFLSGLLLLLRMVFNRHWYRYLW